MNEQREAYLERMSACRPFLHFGIEPKWRPGEGDVEGFCHDEVVRQWHDTRVQEDGGVRVEWMTRAWNWARRYHEFGLGVPDVVMLGRFVEKELNSPSSGFIRNGEFRDCSVWIGNRKGAPPHRLVAMIGALAQRAARGLVVGKADVRLFHSYGEADFERQTNQIVTVDDWYLAYEWVHPWPDGNGRTGKILHNWLGGTLDEPVLVPDYFGGGNP